MGPSGADRTQVGPMLAPWTFLYVMRLFNHHHTSKQANNNFLIVFKFNVNHLQKIISVFPSRRCFILPIAQPSGCLEISSAIPDDVIKWKPFPCYRPVVRGIHRSPVDSPHKSQWRGGLMFPLICALVNKRSSKPSRRRWFETPSRLLWRPCNGCRLISENESIQNHQRHLETNLTL